MRNPSASGSVAAKTSESTAAAIIGALCPNDCWARLLRMAHEQPQPLVRIVDVSKSYGGVQALESVSFDIAAGEVHALCGENGAGKSTLNKILSGSLQADSGFVTQGGGASKQFGVKAAEEAGIAIVHQESVAFPDLDATDNVFLLRETGNVWLDRASMRHETRRVLETLGEQFSVDVPLDQLTLAQRQMVGIARALVLNCRLLILDEPTGSLSERESQSLFAVIRRLRSDGVSILYVSHRLEEVFELADRVTVLRDGKHVATMRIPELDRAELIRLMVGREVAHHSRGGSKAPSASDSHDLQFDNLNGVSLTVAAGEVVVLSGLVGSGRSELARAAFGIDPPTAGRALLGGVPIPPNGPGQAISMGLAYLPEDRQHEGLHLPMTIRDNLSMAESLSRLVLRGKKEASLSAEFVSKLAIKTPSDRAAVASLSGGNQQKVLLGKWLATRPKALILDEPTRGVDVGAKAEIHRLIRELADGGVAVLVISSDLLEVMSLADRVIVLRQGQIGGELGAEASQEQILELALPQETEVATNRTERRRLPKELPIALVLGLAILVCSLVNPSFLSAENLRDLLVRISPAVIVGSGLTLVILAREIDISMGSLMGTCAAVLGVACSMDRLGMPIPAGVALCLGAGLGVGIINGLLVGLGRIPSIIVTLGMLTVLQGFTERLLGGEWISKMPEGLRAFGTGSLGGVPYIVIVALATALVCTWIGSRTPFGRRVYAMGSNPIAAETIGVPVTRIKVALFALVGLLSGVAALFSATQLQIIESGFGKGFELTAVAAVVVGGTSIRGGRGSILGTVLGAALLGSIGTMLIFLKLGDSSVYWERAIGGAIILVAIIVDHLSRRKEASR